MYEAQHPLQIKQLKWKAHKLGGLQVRLPCSPSCGHFTSNRVAAPAQRDLRLGKCVSCFARLQSGDLPTGDVLPLAWTAWSLVHGIAKLAISGNLPLNARATIEFTRRASQAIFGEMAVGQRSVRTR